MTLFTLSNGHRMSVNITNYGGVVQAIRVPHGRGAGRTWRSGSRSCRTMSTTSPRGQEDIGAVVGWFGQHIFGAIIGRYANRIANAAFTMKCSRPGVCDNNGTTYKLDANNGTNTLHGGYLEWNTQVWRATPLTRARSVALSLTRTFPAGEGCLPTLSPGCTGFPAMVTATVTYILTDDNALRMQYKVVNDAPAGSDATVINLTNHTYFNLGGEGSGSVADQDLAINSNRYQPGDTNLIPVHFARVVGTAYDFRTLHPIGQRIRDAFLPDRGGQRYPQLVIAHGYDNKLGAQRLRPSDRGRRSTPRTGSCSRPTPTRAPPHPHPPGPACTHRGRVGGPGRVGEAPWTEPLLASSPPSSCRRS